MGNATISGLRHAVPYLRLFRGKLFVIKVGGEAFVRPGGAEALLEQVGVLQSLGIHVVLVHGGGSQADALASSLGIPFEKVDGRRRTSEPMVGTMIQALNGEVQGVLLGAARRLGLAAVGLNGMDAGLVLATRRSKGNLGEVGDVVSVDPRVLRLALSDGLVPFVSPLSGDQDGKWLNINADTVAAELAVVLGAEKVVFLTGAPGILRDIQDPNSMVSELSLKELIAMEKSGELAGGMLPKAEAIRRCLVGGVPRVHVVSFAIPDALLIEVFTNEGAGTLIEA